MQKVIATLTALTFSLGLAGAGLAQTAAKEAEKPAVKMETPAVAAQSATVEKGKPEDKTKPATTVPQKPGKNDQKVKDVKGVKDVKDVKEVKKSDKPGKPEVKGAGIDKPKPEDKKN